MWKETQGLKVIYFVLRRGSYCQLVYLESEVYFPPCYTVSNLKALLNALCPVRASWYYIGLELDIPHTELDCFKRMYPNQFELMSEMLKFWLRTAENPRPSWEAIVRALRSPLVNEGIFAAQMEFKYCAPVQQAEESSSPAKVEESKGITI